MAKCDFIILICLQPYSEDLRYFKLWVLSDKNNLSLQHQSLTPWGCEYLGITKLEFVAKTQFLWQLAGGGKKMV